MNIWKKTKNWISDRYHILFKSAAVNHLRIQEVLKNNDGSYQLTVKFGSYSELKQYQKKLRRATVSLSGAVAMIIVAFIAAPYIMNPNRSSAASYFWSQTSWDSAANPTATIAKPGPGTSFQSMDANLQVNTPAPGDSNVSLKLISDSKKQSDNGISVTGFNLDGNIKSQTEVTPSGTDGSDASVGLQSISNEDYGDGRDGTVTISSAKNINIDTIAAGRTCADGVSYNVVSLTSNTAKLSATPPAGCFAAGDKIMLLNEQGTSSSTTNTGNYEFLSVQSISGDTIAFASNKSKYYGDNANQDDNIGTLTTATGDEWTTASSYSFVTMVPSADPNSFYYFPSTTASTTLRKYNISSSTFDALAGPGLALNTSGVSGVYPGGDYVYYFQGGSTAFWAYSISNNSWNTVFDPADAPAATSGGASLAYPGSGDYIYAVRGGNTAEFWRYSISLNKWETGITALPGTATAGTYLLGGFGNDIYVARGGYNTFWKYSISSNSWTVLSAAPGNFSLGASLVYPKSGDFIYASVNGFSAYSISNNSWLTFNPKDAPATLNMTGGSMIYPGSGDYMYAGKGASYSILYKYQLKRGPNQRVILQRVPQYDNVTVASGGTLTASAWDGTKGGVLAYYAKGTVSVESGGIINMDASGYRSINRGYAGESYNGIASSSNTNLGGGSSIQDTYCIGDILAGGGYGSVGNSGYSDGGASYGNDTLTKIFLGSAGGGFKSTGTTNGGGGIIFINANNISVSGAISNNGLNGGIVNGGGSGGSIFLKGDNLNLNENLVSAVGGANFYDPGYNDGGDCPNNGTVTAYTGGVGRIYLQSNNISGSSLPIAATGQPASTFQSSGSFVSGAIDTGQVNNSWGNISWSQTLNGGSLGILISTSVNGSVWTNFKGTDGSDQTDCAAGKCYTTNTGQQINVVHNGARYIKYKVFLTGPAGDNTKTPLLNDVTLNYEYYPTALQKFVSSPFNIGDKYASINDIKWTKGGTGTIKFQIKAADSEPNLATSAEWCGPTACGKNPGDSNDFYTLDAGGNILNSIYTDHSGNQWVQYAAFLRSDDGNQTPVLNDVTLNYSFNTPPEISVPTAIQLDSTSDIGKVNINYQIKETKGDDGIVEQSSTYVNLFYQLEGVKVGDNTGALGNADTNTLGDVTLDNLNENPIPSIGKALIGTELVSFTSNGNILNITGRHQDFATNYSTLGAVHAKGDDVYFLATNVTGANIELAGITENFASKNIIWNAKEEPYVAFDGKNFSNVKMKVVANDGDAFNPIGSNSALPLSLDYEHPNVTSVVANFDSIAEPEKTSGLFGIGKTIPVKVTFSEAVTTVGSLTVKLDMGSGRTSDCTVSIASATDNAGCNVLVNENDTAEDLALIASGAITGTVKDKYANTTVNPASPAKLDLHDSPNVKVDGVKPTVTSVSETSNNANNKKAKAGDEVTLSIATSEVLKSGTVPTVSILGHSITATGTQSPYSAKYTLVDTDTEGDISFNIVVIDAAGNVSTDFNQDNTDINGGFVVFDRTKPTLSNISASSSSDDKAKAKANDTVTLNFTASEALQTPVVKIGKDSDGNFRTATSVTNVGNIYTATYTMADTDKEEDVPYSIEFKDEAGNSGDVVNGNTGIIFDRTKPTVAERTKVITPTNDSTPDYTFSANEAGKITYLEGCVSTTSSAVNGDNTVTFNQLNDGTYSSCTLTVTDPAGNVSYNLAISSFEVDTVGKNISTVYPSQGTHLNKMDVKFTLEEQIQSGNIILTDQNSQQTQVAITAENYSAGTEHSQTISNLSEGTYTIEITGKDLADNDMQSSVVTGVVYDTTAPTLSITAPEYFNSFSADSDISFSIDNNNETLKDGRIAFKDSSNTLPDQTCNLKAASLTNGDHQKVNLADQCEESIVLVDGTSYSITFSATDLAGNTQSNSIDAKNYDITPPYITSFISNFPTTLDGKPIDVSNPIGANAVIDVRAVYNEPIENGSNVKVHLDLSASDPVADLQITDMDLKQWDSQHPNEIYETFTVRGPRKGYDTTPNSLNVREINPGENAIDRAGNIGNSSNINNIQNLASTRNDLIIDTGTPLLQSFTAIKEGTNINSGSYSIGEKLVITANYSKDLKAGSIVKIKLNTGQNAREITLTNQSSGRKLTYTYEILADENAEDLKVDSIVEQRAEDFRGNILDTIGSLSAGNDTYDAYFDSLNQDIPHVSNISGFRIDTIAPTLGEALEETPLVIQNTNGKTSDTTPNITLSASDNFNDLLSTGKVYYKLSGNVWCGPIDYKKDINQNEANEISIVNSTCGGNANNGSKILTVKFVDSAKNESAEASASVELDSQAPILQSFTTETEGGMYGSGTSIKIVAIYNENISSGRLELVLNNTVPVVLDSVENGNQLTTGNHPYVIGATNSGQSTGSLRVASIQSQNVSDLSDPVNTQTEKDVPGDNLDKGKTIAIDVDAPTSTLTIDRFSEDNKFKLSIKPDDFGVPMDGMTAQVKILNSDSACNFSDAISETFTEFPQTFSYDDTNDSIRKACVKLTDKAGNVSQIFESKAPNTPQQFSLMDLTNDSLTGAILTWSKPTEWGSGDFAKYDLLTCQSPGSDACVPDQSHEITSKDENYKVFTQGLSKANNYCYRVVFKDLDGNISKSSPTICGVPGQGPALSNTAVDFKELPFVGDITKDGAKVVFQTINKNDSNAPLATTADVEVFADQDLTGTALAAKHDDLGVIHSVSIAGLESSKKYYLRIKVTDPTGSSKTISYGATKTADTDPTLTFTTAGVLSSIDAITESIITDSKAVINFTTNEDARCFVDFKESSTASYNELSDNLEKDLAKSHSITLTQLLAKTLYDYKITCDDTKGKILTSEERHFETAEKGMSQGDFEASQDKSAPEISNISLSSVTGENATVTWTTNEVANSVVLYEADGTDFMLMAGDSNVYTDASKYSTSHAVSIKNLIPASKYLFTVISTDGSGNIAQSAQSNFTTKEPSSLSSIKVQSKALGQATITWETGAITSSLVEYGLTTSYGQKKEDSSKVKQHSITLSDLTPGETYHFRVKGVDDQSNVFASSDITFQPKAPPKISDFKVDSITEHGAVVAFNTNVSTNAIVSFENTDDKEDSGFQGRPDFVSKHEIKLKDLTSGATFSLKLKVRDEEGNETEETFPNFTTTKDEVPPKIERVKTDSALTQNDKVQAIISWSTDELSTGEIVYKEGKSGSEKKFEVNSAPSFSHIGVITSFKSGVVYYFKVVSEDQAGNKITSSDYALLTPKQRQNIIQIIIGNFTDIFGWAKF